MILEQAKATSFEQQVKILEKSQQDTFLICCRFIFKGFDEINGKLLLQKYILVTNASGQASKC